MSCFNFESSEKNNNFDKWTFDMKCIVELLTHSYETLIIMLIALPLLKQ